MKSYFFLLLSAIVLASSCNPSNDYGDKIEYGKSEVYYSGKGVTEKEAKAVGDYLKEIGYFKNKPKTVQLTNDGEDFLVHLVADKGELTDAQRIIWWRLQDEISKQAFDGESVRIAFADDKLKDFEVLDPVAKYTVGKSIIYYDNSEVKKADVKALADYLGEMKLLTEENGALAVYRKEKDVPVIRMVVNPKTFNDEMLPAFSFIQEQMREKLFDGEKAKLVLTSGAFEDMDPLPKLTDEQRQAFLNELKPKQDNPSTEDSTNYLVDTTVTQTSSGVLRLPNE
ncbi:MAG: hypothetical protein EON98_03155 [Chitinophagaceae bacterium]|nr:MAG: hypothetical protein EON98_03155 [Chitinophagaceae bacterium]